MGRLQSCLQRVREADELRFRDPGKGLIQAREACELAASLEPTATSEWHLLQSEAWAVLGSAYRAVGDFTHAENSLNMAIRFLDALESAPVEAAVWARLTQRASYLRCSQKRFEEALDLNDDVLDIYRREGDEQAEYAALVDRALILARSGRPREAVPLLTRSLDHLDPDKQTRSRLAAVHNMAYYRLQIAETDAEEREATKWLDEATRLHQHHPEPLALWKLQGMAALTAIRFGRRKAGITSLWQVCRELGELGALPEQLLTLLHLTDYAVEHQDGDEVTRIAGLMFPLLGRSRLADEPRQAVLRVLSAARSRSVTRELVARATEELQAIAG